MTPIIMMSILMSILFMLVKHPMSMGFILLIQTIMAALVTGLTSFNFWFSYILFLVMVGGMLILFVYMTSVASNEKFKFSPMVFSISIISMICPWSWILFKDKMTLNWKIFSQELLMMNKSEINLSLSKLLNWPEMTLILLVIIYLLITLVMAVKITYLKSGPLRQKF